MLNSIGVAVRDSKGEFLDFDTIIQNTSKAFQSLSNTQQMAVAQAIGGTHHYSKYISLLNNMDIATRATETALNSQGSALQENEKYLNSVSGQYEVFKTNLEAVKQSTINSDDLKFILSIGNGMTKIAQGMGGFTTTLVALNTVLLLTNKSYKEWISGMTFKSAIDSLKTFSANTKVAIAENGVLKGSVNSLSASFTSLGISAKLTQAAITMGLSIGISLLISGVMKLGEYLFNAKQRMKEFNEETTTFIKETGKNYSEVNKLIKEQEKLEDSLKSGKLTTEEAITAQQELQSIQSQIADILPKATTKIDEQNQSLATNLDITKQLNEEQKKLMADKATSYLGKNDINNTEIQRKIDEYKQAKEEYDRLQLAAARGEKKTTISRYEFSQVEGQYVYKDYEVNVQKELDKFGEKYRDIESNLREIYKNIKIVNETYGEKLFDIDLTNLSEMFEDNTKKIEDNTKAKKDNADVEINNKVNPAEEFEKATQTLDFYRSALDEINDKQGLTSGTILDIVKNHQELIPYLDDEVALREKLNELIGTEEQTQQKAYQNMLTTSEQYYNSKIKGNADMQNQLIKLFNDYGGKLTDGYNGDLKAYRNLEQAKADMTTNLLRQLAGSWASYWRGQDFSDEMWYGLRWDTEETKRLQGIRDKINEMQNSFNNITIPTINVGGISNVGKIGSGSGSSQKDIADIDLKTERYYNLEKAIDRVNDALDRNKTLQEQANGKEKTKLMQEEIALLQQKQKAIENLRVEEQKERAELEKRLKANGFTLSDGEIKNLNARLQALQNSANSKSGQGKEDAINNLKDLEEATKRYIDLMNNELPNSDKEWIEVGNTIKQVQEDMLNSLKETQEKMTEVIKAEVEKRKKAIDDELDKKKKALEEEKNLYNKQNTENDYKSELAKEQQKLMEIQDSIDRMSRDTTAKGKAKLDELMAEYKAQQEKIDEMIKNNQRDRVNEQFEEEQKRLEEQAQKEKDALDKKYDDKTIAQIALQAITNGFYEFEGEIINTQNAMSDFLNETGESLLVNGQLLQKEMIDKLKEAAEIIKNLGSINISLGVGANGVPSYDVGTSYVSSDQYARIHKGEMIIPSALNPLTSNKFTDILRQQIMKALPKLPSPIGQTKGGNSMEFHEPFIVIQGNVTEDVMPEFKSVVDTAIKDLKRWQQEQFQAQGIY